MTTVYWSPMLTKVHRGAEINEADILFEQPKPLMKELLATYKNHLFMKCPSTQASCKNVFVVTAPMDADIFLTSNPDELFALNVEGSGWDQNFYDAFCELRKDGTVSMPPSYLFYAKKSLEMEVSHAFLLDSPSLDNTLVIPGSFDIGKWVRPIDFTFVVKDPSKPVKIKRGEPLFFIRFKTDERVEFIRVEYSKKLHDITHSCVQVKKRVPNLSLSTLYALAKSRLDLFFKGLK
jgi:hypothetical protein